MQIELSLQVDPAFQGKIDQEHLNKIVLQTLRREGITEPLTLGLLITDDDNIKGLNVRYRGEDRETDVLAFRMENGQGTFVSPPSVPVHLGDVVVSYARAVAQAEAYGHPIEQELDRLVVHGLLHLLGYDDQGDEDRERMWKKQEMILRDFQADGRR